MKSFNSKQKGSTYERRVAKLMTDWWGGEFSRVPASGGLRWGADQRVAGDIVPPLRSNFPFVIECKKHEGWGLHNLLLNTGPIRTWWEQVILDCTRMAEHGMAPCLVFSKNRDKDYILIPYVEDVFNLLASKHPVSRQIVEYNNIRDETQYFDTLLTTFEGLSSLSKEYIQETYQGIEWNNLNN